MTNKNTLMIYLVASSSLCAWVFFSSMYDFNTRFVAWIIISLYLKIVFSLNSYEFNNKTNSLNNQESRKEFREESHDVKMLSRLNQDIPDWNMVCQHQKLSEEFIREFNNGAVKNPSQKFREEFSGAKVSNQLNQKYESGLGVITRQI